MASVGEALRAADQDIEIAFLDLNLSDGNGLSFMEKLLKDAPHTRPIVISADTDIRSGINAMKAGAYDYLPKPLQMRDVWASARKALGSAA